VIDQREADFQQQVFASSFAPTDKLLFWRMFHPEQLPIDQVEESGLWQPTSASEWEAMAEAWEMEDRKAMASGQSRPFAQTMPLA
jgi:hypothetical protein